MCARKCVAVSDYETVLELNISVSEESWRTATYRAIALMAESGFFTSVME